jgi:hypothetical protein
MNAATNFLPETFNDMINIARCIKFGIEKAFLFLTDLTE